MASRRQDENWSVFDTPNCSPSVCRTQRAKASASTQPRVSKRLAESCTALAPSASQQSRGSEGNDCHTCFRRALHSESLTMSLRNAVTGAWPNGVRRRRLQAKAQKGVSPNLAVATHVFARYQVQRLRVARCAVLPRKRRRVVQRTGSAASLQERRFGLQSCWRCWAQTSESNAVD